MQLTHVNYYGLSANREYLSNSLVSQFRECEQAAMAYLRGDHEFADKDCYRFGRFVDVALTGTPDDMIAFIESNPELFLNGGVPKAVLRDDLHPTELEALSQLRPDWFVTRGPNKGQLKSSIPSEALRATQATMGHFFAPTGAPELKADYRLAEACIERVRAEPGMMKLLAAPGAEYQVILQGEIAGSPFRGMLDVLHRERNTFVDLKTTRGFDSAYDPARGRRAEWWERYETQMAVYQELLRQNTGEEFDPVIAAVSKTKIKDGGPGLRLLVVSDAHYRLSDALDDLDASVRHIAKIRSGEVEAEYCRKCAYCNAHAPLIIEEVT